MNPMLASVLSSTPADARPKSAGAPRGADGAAGGEFAGCMEQARDAATAPNAASADAAHDKADATTTDAAAETSPSETPSESPGTTDLSALLPGWVPPQVSTPAAVAAATAPADDAGDDALAAIGQAGTAATALLAAGTPTPRTSLPRNDGAASSATPQPAPAALAAPRADAAVSASALPATTTRLQGEAHALGLETAAAGSALQQPATPPLLASVPRAAEAPAVTALIAAAIDTPAFAPALATQVRWWAQDGVQQAQLTLNPPEMGPVTVKIVVFDGREARIDFSADMAATRNAIEGALPVLAAALDESGLKLAGGGVHDGTAQRQLPWQAPQTPAGRSRGTAAHDGDFVPPGVGSLRPGPARGLVDLVA